MSFYASDARVLALDAASKSRFSPAVLAVFEWHDYFFQFPGAPILRVGGREIAPIAPGLFRVRWENSLGLCALEPRGHEQFWVEVLSPKFPSLESHFALFSALLDSLFESSRHLVWDFRGETQRAFETGNNTLSPLEMLEWTLFHAPTIEAIWCELLARPKSRLHSEKHLVPAAQVAHVDGVSLRDAVQNPSRWENGAPRELQTARAVWSHDTPENRRALHLGRMIARALKTPALAPVLAGLDFPKRQKLARLQGIFAQLEGRFAHEIPVRDAPHAPPRSAIGARLEALEQSQIARGRPIFAPVEQFAAVRDVASLWEFWVFFALVKNIEIALQCSALWEARFDETRGLLAPSRARWGEYCLVFNGPAPSYSTPLRPDFLWFRGEKPLAAFDAKFRFDGDNLHKMHAYCDALQIGAAVAITPGRKTTFFDRERGPLNTIPLRATLENSAQGVGLWGLLP